MGYFPRKRIYAEGIDNKNDPAFQLKIHAIRSVIRDTVDDSDEWMAIEGMDSKAFMPNFNPMFADNSKLTSKQNCLFDGLGVGVITGETTCRKTANNINVAFGTTASYMFYKVNKSGFIYRELDYNTMNPFNEVAVLVCASTLTGNDRTNSSKILSLPWSLLFRTGSNNMFNAARTEQYHLGGCMFPVFAGANTHLMVCMKSNSTDLAAACQRLLYIPAFGYATKDEKPLEHIKTSSDFASLFTDSNYDKISTRSFNNIKNAFRR